MFHLSKTAVCWAAKGGSGTSVVVACAALSTPHPVLIVDLAGDQSTVLGVTGDDRPGLDDWLVSDAPPARLAALEVRANEHVSLLTVTRPQSHRSPHQRTHRWAQLARWIADDARPVLIDAGTQTSLAPELLAVCDQSLLVTRACYLALRAAALTTARPTGVVVIREPGRSLKSHDIAAAIGAPVVAEVLLDPAIARAVDAGLLAARLPRSARSTVRAKPVSGTDRNTTRQHPDKFAPAEFVPAMSTNATR